tara:strand:- start:200 stop:889 length:690 start_codon:yes stop_codon:yes gene_type:complete
MSTNKINYRKFSSINEFISSIDSSYQLTDEIRETFVKLDSEIDSSYSENSYASLFYFLSSHFKPKIIAELGVLGCYSIIPLALGALNNNKACSIKGYDLFEEYSYKSFSYQDALERISSFGLKDFVSLKKFDVYVEGFIEEILKISNLVHIDLSHDGKMFEKVLNSKINSNAIIIMEGGSEDRDNVEWMKTYSAKKISPVIEKYSKIRDDLLISVIEAMPSVTVIQSLK